MSQTQITCPRCRQPITAIIEQLFDVTADPGAKQRLLGGVSNRAQCPSCGYSGQLATPIVYHDADKELLLTYFPAEMGLPVNEQERMIGPLINQVVNRLPADKRKAYLLRPQSHLTYQSLVERILGADGITPEMLKAQQDRVALIERLLSASADDVRAEIIKQEAALLDEQFFALFSRLMQSAAAGGQEQVAGQLAAIQEQALAGSEFGRQLKARVGEVEAAAQSLQQAGRELTREKLLEIILEAPNEDRVQALVSLARPGLDYVFFQTLSERIDAAQGDEKERLAGLRERLLDYVNEIDKQMEETMRAATEFVEQLLAAPDIAQATRDNLGGINEAVVQVLNAMLRDASEKKDAARLDKLRQIVTVLQQASAPPPELALIEQMLEAPDDATLDKMLNDNAGMITPQFMEALSSLAAQTENPPEDASAEDRIVAARLQAVYRAALRFTMQRNMK